MTSLPYCWQRYNRLLSDRNSYTQEFLNGVNQFKEFAHKQLEFQSWGKYRCLCAKCKNRLYLTPNKIKIYLMYEGLRKDIGIG